MSLTRQFLRDFAPLFRVLEQPFSRSPAALSGGFPDWNRFDSFDTRPAIDIAEQNDKYILDAEVPGVSKEDINIRVGDSGRSITIEGKVLETKPSPTPAESESEPSSTTQLSTERSFTRDLRFSRTVWLPLPVNTNDMIAKLENGVLRIEAKKATDEAATSIQIQ